MRSSVVAVVFSMVACSKPAPSSPAPPDPDATTAIVQLGAYRDQACACTDAACITTVGGERATWLAAEQGRYQFTDEQRADADATNQAYDACVAKPQATEAAGALEELQDLSDEMCACKDKACAEHVTEDMMKMGEKYKDTKATDAEMKTASKITEELTKCMSKAMGMGSAP